MSQVVKIIQVPEEYEVDKTIMVPKVIQEEREIRIPRPVIEKKTVRVPKQRIVTEEEEVSTSIDILVCLIMNSRDFFAAHYHCSCHRGNHPNSHCSSPSPDPSLFSSAYLQHLRSANSICSGSDLWC